MKISLPSSISGHEIWSLLEILSENKDAESLELSFKDLRYITPVGFVVLTSWFNERGKRGLVTSFSGLESCCIKRYLQRMNFFHACGERYLNEDFNRHGASDRFVPLKKIPFDVGALADEMADVIAPGGGDYESENAELWDAAHYLITELANNVSQHGRGEGYIVSQTTEKDDMVKIAICDDGMGIRKSLLDGRNDIALDISDKESIVKALIARVSSKGQPSNEGVGLTLSSKVISLMGGQMLLCSGNGVIITDSEGEPNLEKVLPKSGIQGTLVGVSFKRSSLERGFFDQLQKAKELKDLLQEHSKGVNYS